MNVTNKHHNLTLKQPTSIEDETQDFFFFRCLTFQPREILSNGGQSCNVIMYCCPCHWNTKWKIFSWCRQHHNKAKNKPASLQCGCSCITKCKPAIHELDQRLCVAREWQRGGFLFYINFQIGWSKILCLISVEDIVNIKWLNCKTRISFIFALLGFFLFLFLH